jgi:hypothetical protein
MQIVAPPHVIPSPSTIIIIAPVVMIYLLKLVFVEAYWPNAP